jgi:hypothetical protein
VVPDSRHGTTVLSGQDGSGAKSAPEHDSTIRLRPRDEDFTAAETFVIAPRETIGALPKPNSASWLAVTDITRGHDGAFGVAIHGSAFAAGLRVPSRTPSPLGR